MATLINNETGLAEQLPDQAAQAALANGTHAVPLIDPQGQQVNAPMDQVGQLMQQGYQKPSEQHLQELHDYARHSTPMEQLNTVREGMGSALSFGTSNIGKTPEEQKDTLARQEANPTAHTIGELGGLAAGMFTGTGEAAILEGAGKAVAEKVAPMMAENALGRIGTQATKAAVENMMFQAGDEASKMFLSDPNQSAETAMANIGMAGALGGVLGGGLKGAGELWDMGPGKSIESTLQALQNRSAGLPTELKTAADLSLAPEIEAALGDTPQAKQMAAELMESNTSGGTKFQAAMGNFKRQIGDAVAETLDVDPAKLEDLRNESKYDTGNTFKEQLTKSIKEKVQPIADKYEEFQNKFKAAEVSPDVRLDAVNKISQMQVEDGLLKGANDSALKMSQKVSMDLDKQATAQDLRNYIRGLNDQAPYGSENYQVAKKLKGILSDVQEQAVEKSATGTADYAAFKATQAEYGKFKGLLEDLNDRLHLGREAKYGPGGFVKALSDMDGEKVVDRLGLRKSVDLQNLLAQHFPEVNELARQQELQILLKKSIGKDGESVDLMKLSKQMEALSPELRSSLFTPEQSTRLEALQDLAKRVPQRMNPSGTARTLDMLWSKVPSSAGAMAGMVMGHNPIMGAIIGGLAHTVGKEAPDAVKLAMLKFMGSNMPISGTGFRAAVKTAAAMLKGEAALNKSAKAVFEGSMDHVSMPSEEAISKLSTQVDALIADPTKILSEKNDTAHYLPEHADVISLAAARNLQYLASLRPNVAPLAPLDSIRTASSTEDAKYKNALQIAENPMLVMKKVKDGSLTSEDLQHLHAMYPALAQRMNAKLTEQLVAHKSKDGHISYPTQLSLSAMMAQPLSHNITPQAIMASQPMAPNSGMLLGAAPSAPKLKNANKLDKLSGSYLTPMQSREMHRSGRR